MSNLVLPSLSSTNQIAQAWPIKKSPSYSTVVQTPASKRGQNRISLASNPIWKFDLDIAMMRGDLNQTSPTAIQALLDFYGAMLGAGNDFLYQDPYDNAATAQLIGYGDGSTTQFQIGRSLNGLSFEMMQNVFPTAVTVGGSGVPAGPQASGNFWYSGLENLLDYSQDFSQTIWVKDHFTDSHATIVAPDGTTSADALTATSNTTVAVIQNTGLSFPPGTVLTFSVWLKLPTGSLSMPLAITSNQNTIASTSAPVTTTWTRFTVTGTTTYGQTSIMVQIGAGGAWGIANGQVVHVWGAQLERWTAATSYTVTTNNAPVYPRGVLTFATAPAAVSAIAVTFNYYYRCHFVDDEWSDLNEFLYQYWELPSMKFESLIL